MSIWLELWTKTNLVRMIKEWSTAFMRYMALKRQESF
jgi:hypothetical protein